MQQRALFVREAQRGKVTLTQLCDLFGVSRKTGYKWLKRHEDGGKAALADRSRRPASNANAIRPRVVDRLVRLRKEHPTWGARKLIAWLERNEGKRWDLPAASTVTELLKREGLVVPRVKSPRQPPRTAPFASADRPNAVWTVDFKGDFSVGDGTRCYPLTVTDAYSRALLCCQALTTHGGPDVQRQLERTFRKWGLPDHLRSDNGSPFGTMCMGPISWLSVWLLKVGVMPEYIDPASPHQNGRHERFHRTLKSETAYPPGASIPAQQRRFRRFSAEYNHERPHEALKQVPPMDVHVRSTREYPARVPEFEYPANHQVRRVERNGRISWQHDSIFISEALRGEPVGLLEVDNGCWEVYCGPLAIGRLHDALPHVGVIRGQRKMSPMSPV